MIKTVRATKVCGSPHELFTPTAYPFILRKLEAGEYVAPEVVATVLEVKGSAPMPAEVRAYICRCLRCEVKGPPGRKYGDELRTLQEYAAVLTYRRLLDWLQQRKKRQGHLNGWGITADWWQGPPHERAAQMTAERFRTVLNVSGRRIENLASEFNKQDL